MLRIISVYFILFIAQFYSNSLGNMMRTHENQMKPERKQLDHRSEIGKALPSASRLARNTTVLRGPSLDDLAANMQLNPLNLLNPLNCICIFHK